MDSYEATRVVFSRLQSLDPDNASKIMGYILLQDTADHDMIRLAFGPESLLHYLILQAKSHLSSGLFPILKSPSSSSSSSASVSASASASAAVSFASNPSLSYASVLNGTANASSATTTTATADGDSHAVNDYGLALSQRSVENNLSFLEEPSRIGGDESLPGMLHRRSYSMPSGTCLYFARGFCKNGSTCRFFHTADSTSPLSCVSPDICIGSPSQPSELDHCSAELAMMHRVPSAVHQKHGAAEAAAAAAIASAQFGLGSTTNNSMPYNKCINFLLQHQNETPARSAAAVVGLAGGLIINPSARQIYLTFPADSTFTEEDVSNYFSIYGPVQDVRIPYQQKRMFGFVTFIYPETVKLILAKGNPHFVCDSRVLVKPYKEKGKVTDKKHHLQLDRGEYSVSPCSSPCGIDSREPFDFPFSPRMFYGNQETMLRKKLMEEEADLSFRQAIELQGRRLMNLQLLELKNNFGNRPRLHHHHYPHSHSPSPSSPIPSPTLSRSPHLPFSNHHSFDSLAPAPGAEYQAIGDPIRQSRPQSNGNFGGKNKEEDSSKSMEPLHNESHGCFDIDHILLPDNLFTSPKKSSVSEHSTVFTDHQVSKNPSHGSSGPTSAPLDMAQSMNSCFLQLPRLSSNHGDIGM